MRIEPLLLTRVVRNGSVPEDGLSLVTTDES